MSKARKPAILISTLDFVKTGKVTQLIGRDILTNQDVTLATFDNVYFDAAWLTDDWQRTAKILGFTLIGSTPHPTTLKPTRQPNTQPALNAMLGARNDDEGLGAIIRWVGMGVSALLLLLWQLLQRISK